MTGRALRIAILAHSTNPRGGVVHALALAEALVRLGHEPVVHAPDVHGRGFFRPTLCETVAVPATPVTSGDTLAMVGTRVADYLRHFDTARHRRFDVFHAQDGISGNALASLKTRRLIDRFARTVHHIDTFADPGLEGLQRRSIEEADAHFVVSRLWQRQLAVKHDLRSTVVENGVDRSRFTPAPDGREPALRQRLGLGPGPVFLSVGGIEERKNAIAILDAFLRVRADRPDAQLIVAGGASLLDHAAYQTRYAAQLMAAALPPGALLTIAAVPDADMPALYRIADTLVFPSLKEGFGLVILEAMASGVPVVTSMIAPFTDYLSECDVLWCDPLETSSIAQAMVRSLDPSTRAAVTRRGTAVAAAHDWLDTARAHLPVYATMRALHHA